MDNALSDIKYSKVVTRIIAESMSMKAACDAENIPYQTFRHWLSRNEDYLQNIAKEQVEAAKAHLGSLALAEDVVIADITETANDPARLAALSLAEKITLLRTIREISGGLQLKAGISTDRPGKAANFIGGLTLRPGVSKISQTKTVVTFDDGEGEKTTTHTQIIDADAE